MDRYIKKIIEVGIFITLFLFSGQSIFAQSQSLPLSSMSLDLSTKILTIGIQGNEPGKSIVLFREKKEDNTLSEIGSFPWREGSVSVNLSYFRFESPYAYDSNNTAYSAIQVKSRTANGIDSTSLQRTSFETLLGNGGQQSSSVTVNFPGWDSETKFKPIPSLPGKYYPYIKSKDALIREPASSPLYLILAESRSGTKSVLEPYPAGASSFKIEWPKNVPTKDGGLKNGVNYEIYLSDSPEGTLAVDYGSSETTMKTLGPLPEPDLPVEITNTSIKKANGKTYYEIKGSVKGPTKEQTMINLVIRPEGASNGGQLLGQVPYFQGQIFTTPRETELQNFNSLADGNYELAMNYVGPLGVPEPVQAPTPLPPIGEGQTSGNNQEGGSGQSGGGEITPYITPNQQDVLDKGVVPYDCGYNLSKGGRMCGFGDIIKLIERGIAYIFVIMLPITAIVFAYAGYLFITSGGNPNKKTAAKKAMTSVLIGIIIVMAAFLMVRTLLVSIGVQPADWVYLDI